MRTIGKIDRAMLDQNIEYHDRILDLEEALRIIALPPAEGKTP